MRMVNNQLGELLDCDVPLLRRIKDNQTQASEAKILHCLPLGVERKVMKVLGME
jgi:glutamine synthetase type III